MKEKTIKKSIEFEGIGIHTKEFCKIKLHPSTSNGIIFYKDGVEIPLSLEYVVDTDHGTDIGKDGVVIKTIEHLTSSLFGLSIDNLIIEVNGPEIPILDGSSKIFCEGILKAGIKELKSEKKITKIKDMLILKEEGKFIGVKAAEKFSVKTIVSYEHPEIFFEFFEMNNISDYFVEVSKARTFGILKYMKELKKKGLIKGSNYKNLLLFDENKNITRKRYKNEVARHKCLDFLGDISLFSINIIGDFLTFRTGHTIHYKFLKLLRKKEELWNII